MDHSLNPLVDRGNSCLVGKLIADRTMPKDIIKLHLSRAWKPTSFVIFRVLGENLFLIGFEHDWDKARVMEGHLWTFNGHLVSLANFDGFTPPTQMDFDKVAFWVRIFNLPLACMSQEVGMQIGSSVGKVEEVDVAEDGVGWGEFLRVKILLDLSRPLSCGRMIDLKGKSMWVVFQYEKIPKYCFRSGIIKHGLKGCGRNAGRRLHVAEEEESQFVPWLRASSPQHRHGT